jgi:hypothetical protein
VRPRAAAALLVATPVLCARPATAQADRVQQYLGLAEATRAQPVTTAELDAAVLSPAGIEDVAALFEASLDERVTLDGASVTPELGGEATLEGGRVRFVVYPDPIHPVVRRMVALRDDPAEMLASLSSTPMGREVLAGAGGLHALLYRMTTQAPAAAERRAMDEVLRAAVARYFKTWTVTPETQAENIARHDWRGRYVGFWHLHPPRPGPGGPGAGLEPSLEDLQIAVEKGQLLTLVFQPDGFDLYDLSPLAGSGTPALSGARVVRHRSLEWMRRFQAR